MVRFDETVEFKWGRNKVRMVKSPQWRAIRCTHQYVEGKCVWCSIVRNKFSGAIT